jgi:hypothetical protein
MPKAQFANPGLFSGCTSDPQSCFLYRFFIGRRSSPPERNGQGMPGSIFFLLTGAEGFSKKKKKNLKVTFHVQGKMSLSIKTFADELIIWLLMY